MTGHRSPKLATTILCFVASSWSQQSPPSSNNGAATTGARAQVGAVHVMKPRDASTATATAATQPNNPYNGGQVLPNSTTYAIFWGSPADFPPDYVSGIDQFLTGLNGSQYLAIADQYMLGNTTTQFGGNLFDTSSPPPAFPFTGSHSGSDLGTHVCQFLHASGLTPDPNGVYLLYTSNYPPDLLAAGIGGLHGTQPCTQTNGGSAILHIAYMPNQTNVNLSEIDYLWHPLLAPNSYSEGTREGLDLTAHEFMETITDPNGFYRLHVGPPGSSAPILDVLPPKSPLGAMFNSEFSGVYEVQLLTINSLPLGTTGPVIEGADSSLRTTPGYDNVTGLGTPNVPAFIQAFTNLP